MSRDPIEQVKELVEKALAQTDQAVTDRKKLTARFLKEIDREIAEAKRALRLLGDPWKHGEASLQYEAQRIALDKAMTARKKNRREELLRDWKDQLALAERTLELLRELQSLEP